MIPWIHTHRRKIFVFCALLVTSVLGLMGVLSAGAAVFWALIALSFLYRLRQAGAYIADQYTTPGRVALMAGSAVGSSGAVNHAGCGEGAC
ncbi:hypothetical protein [Deinococcus hohokamensis]|uniref:Uncharacterized protein n=1 Tax=Deinococcus hohokamensis TaxID=309883 RepID=A0ABV9IA87_9DEIO